MLSKNKKKIVSVFGTRPEAIKMAPVIKKLQTNKFFISRVVVTAQHRSMLDDVLEFYNIKPDYDLDIMTKSQSLHRIVARCMVGLKEVFEKEKPDLVLVHGDTTTTLASALSAYYMRIPVGHVEAGLRSYDPNNPFPEEQNRRLVDMLCSCHFAPTSKNKKNLLKENLPHKNIFVTGNTVIDALKDIESKVSRCSGETLKKIVLITAHRRENFGEPLKQICRAIRKLSDEFKYVEFVYPVHPNPNVGKIVRRILSNKHNIRLIAPLAYPDMVKLMKQSFFCLTDSGGLQEEAPFLKKPVLVLREITERPEAVEAGTVRVIGTKEHNIYHWVKKLLTDGREYNRFVVAVNPYGDGKASERIMQFLEYFFGFREKKPEEWQR